jgi:hypothetical protein
MLYLRQRHREKRRLSARVHLYGALLKSTMFRARDTTTSKGLLNAVAKMPPNTPDLPKGRGNQRGSSEHEAN